MRLNSRVMLEMINASTGAERVISATPDDYDTVRNASGSVAMERLLRDVRVRLGVTEANRTRGKDGIALGKVERRNLFEGDREYQKADVIPTGF